MKVSERYQRYLDDIFQRFERAYEVAKRVRAKGLDNSTEVEIKIANDMASRVEGLVGPANIAREIREREKTQSREHVAFSIAKDIATGKLFEGTLKDRVEQAIRTGTAILTEGVLVAPTEGIAKVEVEGQGENSYLSIYFTGPIRSAGGTVAALTVLIGDYIRRAVGIGAFTPTEQEVERYVEEVNLYESRVTHLQYKPPDDHIRTIVKNCPVLITGEPTEQVEVELYRDLERMGTNRVRGGAVLVIAEGIAQKAAKVLKYSQKFGLGWDWVESIIKVKKTQTTVEIKPDTVYLQGVVAGRPIFAFPSAKGGFRLRYGKSRTNGLMAKNIHPATMFLLNEYIAIGTHVKLERPGKGAVITPCDSIEGPIVKLKNQDVVKIRSVEQALQLRDEVEEILFLGDILVNVGDFLKANHPLLPSPWVEEWWEQEARARNAPTTVKNVEQAIEHAQRYGVPLHPRYVFFWSDITKEQLIELVECVKQGYWEADTFVMDCGKRVLELLGVEHTFRHNKIRIKKEEARALLFTLGHPSYTVIQHLKDNDVLKALSKACGVEIKNKSGFYVGARMGRPEKAKERRMDDVHVLFPTGKEKERSLMRIYKTMQDNGERFIEVEMSRFQCPRCKKILTKPFCTQCNVKAQPLRFCNVCGKWTKPDVKVHCGKPTSVVGRVKVELVKAFDAIKREMNAWPKDVRGVKKLMAELKVAEPLEKGFLRAKYDVYVFKDGTIRFDGTDVPITHFKPKEVHTPIEVLKRLGYTHDVYGKELEHDDQILQLKPQDVILPKTGLQYFYRVGLFIDELLQTFYNEPAFYNFKKPEDVIGHLVMGLAPHTSGAILGRVIGWVDANAVFAHPYFHTAKRRNCDGDEDALMLLLDALINFSKTYLPSTRGGTMDAPLTLTTVLNPKEVDDEVFNVELVWHYPLEFYHATQQFAMPYEVQLKKVEDVLGTGEEFESFTFTHNTTDINAGPKHTFYKSFKSMDKKVEAQIALQMRIRAVDKKKAIQELILDHFIPDIYGNLRKFSRQMFRCTKCNAKYRRPPLKGVCLKCGGNLTLTIHKGGIEKYLDLALHLAKKYQLDAYLIQRLEMVKKEIDEVFSDDKVKQMGITAFF